MMLIKYSVIIFATKFHVVYRSYLMIRSLTKVNKNRLIWIRRVTVQKLNYRLIVL